VRGFGDLEAAIMDRLWQRGTPTTVREVLQDLLPQRKLAYTTVLTVTDNLFKKGWLRREPDGRAHRYTPVLSREEYGARLMRDALDASGDPKLAFRSFVGQMSATETAALRAALRRHSTETAS
jgi:predicted transcriptional regulator